MFHPETSRYHHLVPVSCKQLEKVHTGLNSSRFHLNTPLVQWCKLPFSSFSDLRAVAVIVLAMGGVLLLLLFIIICRASKNSRGINRPI